MSIKTTETITRKQAEQLFHNYIKEHNMLDDIIILMIVETTTDIQDFMHTKALCEEFKKSPYYDNFIDTYVIDMVTSTLEDLLDRLEDLYGSPFTNYRIIEEVE